MNDDQAFEQIKQILVDAAGEHLRNTIHLPPKTCGKCRGTMLQAGHRVCGKCQSYGPGTAELVGSMIYGGDRLMSGDLLYGYKDTPQRAEFVRIMRLLVGVGLGGHRGCADALVGVPCSYWAAVPSLRDIGSAHPFRALLTELMGPSYAEIGVAASELAKGATYKERRQLRPDYYNILTPIPKGKHIMVIDDTWVSGGHAQSVAMALKRAGAAKVSILAIGRWLDMDDQRTEGVYNRIIRYLPYDPDICPWTGGDCPPRRASVDEPRVGRPPLRCSLHNIELAATGECEECSKLIPPRKKSEERRKPWWQFW